MPSLSLASDYLVLLIAKVRGIQARVAETDPSAGSNPTDDRAVDAVQEGGKDLRREEVREEIRGLDDRQQAELVALLWLGRGDVDPQDWEANVELARQRRGIPTEDYLLGEPLVAEFWAEGMGQLGIDLPIDEQREII